MRIAPLASRALTLSLVAVLMLLQGGGVWAQRRTNNIRLTVGQTSNICIPGTITRVQVLNPGVTDIADYDTKCVRVVGVGPGSTEVIITTARGATKYSAVVTRIEIGQLFRQVHKFLGDIEKVNVQVIGDLVVIDGAALTPEDYGRAQRAVEIFGDKVLNLVAFDPKAVGQVNQILRRSGLTDVQARLVGGEVGSLFLEGSVGSDAEMEKVKAILRAYGLKVENLIKVGGGRQILIDVYFVEMSNSGEQELGLLWPAQAGITTGGTLDTVVPIQPSDPGSTVTLNLQNRVLETTAALNMLFSSGKGRLLAQPRLVCGSGKQASFLWGGEIPIVSASDENFQVEYKEFGVRLNLLPTSDSLGNVQLQILAEVSEPDFARQVRGVPSFVSRRFNTFVSVKEGASIVLSGLFRNVDRKAVNKLPLLGHIPIIGELFKSRRFQQDKTTLVVFVTPRVVSPTHPWIVRTIRDIQGLYEAYADEVGWQVFD